MATFRSKLLDFSQVLHINCLKFALRAPWPGNLGRQSGALGLPGCQLEAPKPLACRLGPQAPWLLIRGPGASWS